MAGSYFFDSRLAKTEPTSYVLDKEQSITTYMNYMNIRLQKMFHYEGLPETLPKEMLEYYLLNNGHCYIAEVNGNLYALLGSFGGEPDAYYRPTRYIVANPGLKLSKDFDLVNDGVLVRNDALWFGLHPLMSRYASLMAENMLTLRTADIMLRVMALLSAPDDRTKAAAEEYLKNLENGKLGVIGENRFFDEGVKMQTPPSNNGSYLTQFIELHQYLTGTFYNEIGLNANFNMKRESIGEGESSLNEDSLLPLSDEMLKCRKEDIDKINAKFGTNITVEFDSAWANNQLEVKLGLEKLANEASQLVEQEEESQEEEPQEEEETQEEESQEEETQEEEESQEEESQEEESDEEDTSQLAENEEEPQEEQKEGDDEEDADDDK